MAADIPQLHEVAQTAIPDAEDRREHGGYPGFLVPHVHDVAHRPRRQHGRADVPPTGRPAILILCGNRWSTSTRRGGSDGIPGGVRLPDSTGGPCRRRALCADGAGTNRGVVFGHLFLKRFG